MKTRAERIHQDKRATQRAFKTARRLWWRFDLMMYGKYPDDTEIFDTARKNRKQRTDCSCQMCRNPRTSKLTRGKHKLTRQEIVAGDREKHECALL